MNKQLSRQWLAMLVLCLVFVFVMGFQFFSVWKINSDGNIVPISDRNVVVSKLLNTTPQSLTVTTEANIALTGSLLLLTGDNDSDNDTIDLQNGDYAGQQLIVVGVATIDGDDTITVGMGDTTCTGCLTVLINEIGDTWGLVWSGSTWATVSNSEVP